MGHMYISKGLILEKWEDDTGAGELGRLLMGCEITPRSLLQLVFTIKLCTIFSGMKLKWKMNNFFYFTRFTFNVLIFFHFLLLWRGVIHCQRVSGFISSGHHLSPHFLPLAEGDRTAFKQLSWVNLAACPHIYLRLSEGLGAPTRCSYPYSTGWWLELPCVTIWEILKECVEWGEALYRH